MKKTTLLIIVLLLSLLVTGCQEAASSIDYAEIPSKAVQNVKNATIVSLGMPQSDVEALIGRGDKNIQRAGMLYKGGLFLQYDGNTLARIAVQGSEIWAGKYGFTSGSPSNEVWKLYGEVDPIDKTVGEWTGPSLVYTIDSEGRPCDAAKEAAYTVSFMLTEELDQINVIILSN